MQRDIGNYGSSGNYGTSSSAPFMNQFYNGYDFSSLIDRAENHLFSTSPALTPLLPQLNSSLQYHQDCNRLLLARLQEVSKQAQGLRQENINLRMVNDVLTKEIESIVSATSGLTCVSGKTDSNVSSIDIDQIAEELRKMYPAEEFEEENDNQEPGTDDMEAGGTKAVQDGNSSDNVDRDLLPKSIAVRSREYLKAASQGSSGGKIAITGQNMSKSGNEAQKVYVPGVVEKEQPLEVEVYNQGMFKTELCNKWQQVGTCPYGGNCQFAHGLDELRPVLRHPRYKTAVCRMVLNGDPCPYGHRCHFRHYLTDEEKLMRSINGNSLNDYISNPSSYTA
ncbi:hypothetical protein Leryth_011256 [Lithospermum erythrorhizon]|nr:hypothetical protein Leryth_011256 [Lithospermum erythrorhizon]